MRLHYQRVKIWLQRSGTCPLSISISCPSSYAGGSDNGYLHNLAEPLLRLIASFSPRWKVMDLSMPFSFIKKLEPQSKDILPLLQSFKARVVWDSMETEYTGNFLTRFLEAPDLQQLSFDFPLQIDNIATFPLIWGHLTDLHIQSMSITEVDLFNIIQLCHNLVTWQVNDVQPPWELEVQDQEFRPQTEVILPKLEMMKTTSGGIPRILQAINAPRLRSLKYLCRASPLMRDDALLSLVKKGASTLRKLTLEPEYLRSEDIVTCLLLASIIT